jgi:hypothetical protein
VIAKRLRLPACLLLALPFALSCDVPIEPSTKGVERESSVERVDSAPGASSASNDGLYRVILRPRDGAIPLNEMHAWTVDVTTAEGEAFRPTRLAFTGGMPQHQHGFITEPRVTRALGPGRFLIEGVKFHMAGSWMLRVELVGPSGPDTATVPVQVEP